ncbi:MAG: hypothetical protein ACLPZM_00360 [Thermoplasmata archaeon]
MVGRTVDLIAVGPCPNDPYDPAAPAWALAAGMATWGDRVRVLHPTGPSGAKPPEGVEALAIDLPLRRPGAAVEGAALALAAGRRLRPDTDLVVRDPFGLGPLTAGRQRSSGPPIAGIVRRVELTAYDGEPVHQHPPGFVGRVETWRDRRAVRRLEGEALAEATRLFYDSPELPALLQREYGVDPHLLEWAPPPVRGGAPPNREAARKALRLPLDVPVVAAPLSSDDPAISGAARMVESFRRVRSLFAGARLVLVGGTAPTEPGLTTVPERDTASFERAFAAADVTIVAPSTVGFDVGAVLALRAPSAVLTSPAVRFPVDPERAVRVAPSEDPAELAAVLAELLADPTERRSLTEAGSRFAQRFDPERVAATVTAERRLLAA